MIDSYMVLHLYNGHTDGLQETHLRVSEFYLLDKSHESLEYRRCVWHEICRRELKSFKDICELSSSSNPDDQVIKRFLGVEQVLEDLVDGISV